MRERGDERRGRRAARQLEEGRGAAAGSRRGWVVRGEGADKLTLAFAKGDKHEVVVDVLFDKNSFQIVYVSSRNMNFSMDGGRQQIHPNYNKWVRNLNGDLREELMRLR